MTLNEEIDKGIACTAINDNLVLDDLEQNDTVNSVDLQKNVESAVEILMEHGKLFFENYKGMVSPITYCNVKDGIITFKE